MANLLNLAKYSDIQECRKYAYGTRSGVRTAANFTINLGFRPNKIVVANLTTRSKAEYYVDPVRVTGTDTKGLDAGTNAKGLLTVAAGTMTYAATGIALTADGMGFTVTVTTASLETNDCDTVWEAFG